MTTENTSTPAANLRDVIQAALGATHDDGSLETLDRVAASGSDADNLHFVEVGFRGRRLRVEVTDVTGDAPAALGSAPSLTPHANAAVHERIMRDLRAMAPEEFMMSLVQAGICTPDGQLTAHYRIAPTE